MQSPWINSRNFEEVTPPLDKSRAGMIKIIIVPLGLLFVSLYYMNQGGLLATNPFFVASVVAFLIVLYYSTALPRNILFRRRIMVFEGKIRVHSWAQFVELPIQKWYWYYSDQNELVIFLYVRMLGGRMTASRLRCGYTSQLQRAWEQVLVSGGAEEMDSAKDDSCVERAIIVLYFGLGFVGGISAWLCTHVWNFAGFQFQTLLAPVVLGWMIAVTLLTDFFLSMRSVATRLSVKIVIHFAAYVCIIRVLWKFQEPPVFAYLFSPFLGVSIAILADWLGKTRIAAH